VGGGHLRVPRPARRGGCAELHLRRPRLAARRRARFDRPDPGGPVSSAARPLVQRVSGARPALRRPGAALVSARSERAAQLLDLLAAEHPDAHIALDFTTPLELLVATILSAQCTDARVNMVTPALFALCRTPADYLALPQAELEELIRPTGFFRNKARAIRECCASIEERFDGRVPETLDELVTLHGVAARRRRWCRRTRSADATGSRWTRTWGGCRGGCG